MKNWYCTRYRLLDGDSPTWIIGPDILAVSPYIASCEALKDAAYNNPKTYLTEPVEVEAAQDTKDEPTWERFTLRAKQTITIHDV